MDRNEWLEARRKGLGGTDMSAVLGVNHFSNPHKVFLEKLGLSETKDNDAMYWGRAKEPIVAIRWGENHPEFKVSDPQKLFYWDKNPIFLGTPDRLLYVDGKLVAGLEIKTTSERLAYQWGEEYSDEIPDMYNIQCQHYMMVTGLNTWYIGVLIGSSDYREYVVRADEKIQKAMVEEGEVFWERVLAEDPPPVDASEASKIFLNVWYKDRNITSPKIATPKIEALMKNRSIAVTDVNSALAGKMECENLIKEFMGDNNTLDGVEFRATWKQSKSRETLDVKKAIPALQNAIREEFILNPSGTPIGEIFENVLAEHTKITTPARTFRVTEKKVK